MEMMRTYNVHFYHFVSLGTAPTLEKQQEKRIKEMACAEYAQYKWGSPIYSHPETNIKFIL